MACLQNNSPVLAFIDRNATVPDANVRPTAFEPQRLFRKSRLQSSIGVKEPIRIHKPCPTPGWSWPSDP